MRYSQRNIDVQNLVEAHFNPWMRNYHQRPERDVESLFELFRVMQKAISEPQDLLAVLRDTLRLLELLFDETKSINQRGEDE